MVRIGPTEVSISDPSATREIYSVKESYRKTPFYTNFVPQRVTNIFSTTDPDLHRRYRRLLSSPMSETSLHNVYYAAVEANANLTIWRIREEMESRGVADVFKWWLFMTTDIIGELSFGESFRMLEQKKKNQYILDLEKNGFMGALRATFPTLIAISSVFPVPVIKHAVAASARMARYAEESLARRQRLEAADPTNAKVTLFSKIYQAAGDEHLTFKEMRDNAMAYIVAGSDTTATTLTYLVWAVCRHPEVKATLFKELETLPADEDFTDRELKQLPYLNQVIDEALRLYPAVAAGLPRFVPPGGATLAGHWIEGGVTVSSQSYTLHRNPEAFPQPEVFNPSRWETPTKAMKDAFFAFGGGSRSTLSSIYLFSTILPLRTQIEDDHLPVFGIPLVLTVQKVCLGLHLARMELRLATALFFRAFPTATVSTSEGMSDKDMEPNLHFLISPKGKRCLIEAH